MDGGGWTRRVMLEAGEGVRCARLCRHRPSYLANSGCAHHASDQNIQVLQDAGALLAGALGHLDLGGTFEVAGSIVEVLVREAPKSVPSADPRWEDRSSSKEVWRGGEGRGGEGSTHRKSSTPSCSLANIAMVRGGAAGLSSLKCRRNTASRMSNKRSPTPLWNCTWDSEGGLGCDSLRGPQGSKRGGQGNLLSTTHCVHGVVHKDGVG